ncbi:esterase [Streptomyces kaniharaensis]|uniref:Esterase n=1 Tax=Streptomyces kaniharaensis TaxID=212423 RepID=A0A6N7KSS7_9ACTN|nr:transglycosylase family protein [Streptomyces kaniharaensis]MQS13054.1 esterase [Streptomyces kaniharaensis]
MSSATNARKKSRAVAVAALLSTVGAAGTFLSAAPAGAASLSTWDKLVQCEASGNWSAINPVGPYYGGLQFDQGTWESYGGLDYAPRADKATPKQQILIGEKVLAKQGQSAWPQCGPAAGLGSDHANPYPDPVPPVSTVTGLGAGSIVTGTVALTATVTDAEGTPTGATFYVDGRAVGTANGSGPSYRVDLDTAGLAEGSHSLTVRAVNDAGQTGPASAAVAFFVANRGTATTATGDFNGDGKDDIVVMYNGGQDGSGKNMVTLYTFLSNGATFNTPVDAWDNNDTVNGSWNWNNAKVLVGDFSGTGKADIAVFYNSGRSDSGKYLTTLYKFANNGSGGFRNPVKVWDNDDTVNGSWNWANAKPVVGDFSGSGKADIAVLYNSGQDGAGKNMLTIYKFASNGSTFNAPVNVWDNNDRVNASWNWNAIKPVVGKFSGSGKADIAVLYNSGQDGAGKNMLTIYKFASNGSTFNAPLNVWDNNDRVNASWNWNSIKAVAGDFSGTGRDDLAVAYNSGQDGAGKNLVTLYKFASNGSGFNTPVNVWDNNDKVNGSWTWDKIKLVAGKFGGAGRSDLAVMYNSGQDGAGKNLVTLYKFASNGSTFNAPVNAWDNNDKVNTSWDWYRADLA